MPKFLEFLDTETGKASAYAWPGGYPIFYLADDNEVLCPACVNKEIKLILESSLENARNGWNIVGADVNWESEMYCAHCDKQIESAYGTNENL